MLEVCVSIRVLPHSIKPNTVPEIFHRSQSISEDLQGVPTV